MDRERPDPDLLLRRVEEEERRARRGKLLVFLGAAPGVGKTYAMLCEARHEKAEGRDVVVGVAETHGRPETESLLAGLETLPRSAVTYRGIALTEFDLDGALRRRPELVLVDELAHTNVEGSRHPKRWQDIDELLDAGIDVHTTMNVQHVESLNDVICQITGIRVRETVPDSILEQAHEIRLVDLPPDELLDRLREGKVYVPAQARRATDNFFKRGNLIALRELALRRTADRVDAQMREYRREHGIDRTWAVSDRVLVCMSWSPHSAPLIRAACRVARGLRAPWFAVHVETPRHTLTEQDRLQLLQNQRLAEQLGADVVTLSGDSAAREILRFARERNVTRIVVGKPRWFSWRDWLFGSFVDRIVLGSDEIDVHVTTGQQQERVSPPETRSAQSRQSRAHGYLRALAMVAAVTLVGGVTFGASEPADVVLLYILGVVIVSMRFDYGPSLASAVASVLAFDFFFVPPYYSFDVADVRHTVTFGVLFFVAIIVSGLTRRVRAQAEAARERERWTVALYSLSRELARAVATEALVDVAAKHVEEVFDCRVVVFVPNASGRLVVAHGEDAAGKGTTQEAGIVGWVFENGREAGRGTSTLPGARGLYLPMTGPRGKLGVLGVIPADPARFEDPAQRRLIEAFGSQVAMAMERTLLADESRRARLDADREELRDALLNSVSHELRTPLAVMTGAASTLLQRESHVDDETRTQLVQTIADQAAKLDALVGNLLDMSRLDSASGPRKEWLPLEEIVGAALSFLEERLAGREVKIDLPDGMLLVNVDGALIERVLVHLIENADRYSPAGCPIEVSARTGDRALVVEVADRGPGVPADEQERIFDRFFRLERDRSGSGLGLGLSICRAVIRAHGGRIWVEDRAGGGAIFKFALPLEEPPSAVAEKGALPMIDDEVAR